MVETGESGGVNGPVAGEWLVPRDHFNLKLPMKKRYEEVSQNLAYIRRSLMSTELTRRFRPVSCITTVKK